MINLWLILLQAYANELKVNQPHNTGKTVGLLIECISIRGWSYMEDRAL